MTFTGWPLIPPRSLLTSSTQSSTSVGMSPSVDALGPVQSQIDPTTIGLPVGFFTALPATFGRWAPDAPSAVISTTAATSAVTTNVFRPSIPVLLPRMDLRLLRVGRLRRPRFGTQLRSEIAPNDGGLVEVGRRAGEGHPSSIEHEDGVRHLQSSVYVLLDQ